MCEVRLWAIVSVPFTYQPGGKSRETPPSIKTNLLSGFARFPPTSVGSRLFYHHRPCVGASQTRRPVISHDIRLIPSDLANVVNPYFPDPSQQTTLLCPGNAASGTFYSRQLRQFNIKDKPVKISDGRVLF